MWQNCHAIGYRRIVSDVTAPSRRERRTAETRVALVRAAQELFHQKGFDETTVDEIAERADVAQRTFFRYFPSKEAVLFAEFEELNEALLLALEARPAGEAPIVSLHRVLRGYLEEVRARLTSLSWVVRTAGERRGFGLEGAAMRKRLTEQLTGALATRMNVDQQLDPRPVAWVGVMLSCASAAIVTCAHDGGDPAERFDGLIAATVHELGALNPA